MRGNAAVFPGTENGYDSEVASNYEAGIKSTWLNDTPVAGGEPRLVDAMKVA